MPRVDRCQLWQEKHASTRMEESSSARRSKRLLLGLWWYHLVTLRKLTDAEVADSRVNGRIGRRRKSRHCCLVFPSGARRGGCVSR